MLGNFGAGGKQEHGRELRADFFCGFLPALHFHLQCYRLQCNNFSLSANCLSKTKTMQTVTLRVAILSDFSARRLSQNFGAKLKQKSAQVRAVFLGNLLAQNCHLQWHCVTVCGVLVVLKQCHLDERYVPALRLEFLPDSPWHLHPVRLCQSCEVVFALIIFSLVFIRAPQKGSDKPVPRGNCRKVSKIFSTLFDAFLPFFCPARKMSKSVEIIFDTFWLFFDMAPLRRPLLRSAEFR